MKKVFCTIFGIVAIAIIVGIAYRSATTSAAAVHGRTCDLAVYPYNPFATEFTIGEAANPHINQLSNAECERHLSYPNAYSPQPPVKAENPIKPGSEHILAPIDQHQHAYFNDSDYNEPEPELYFYKSFVDKFEITIQPDGFNNLIHESITCDAPVPDSYTDDPSDLFDCDGFAATLFGGTQVTKFINPGNQTITITWNFAENAPYTGRPQIYGNNGVAFTTPTGVTLNLTDESSRKLEFHVNLPTRDNGEIWSATTTSRASIGNLAIRQDNYHAPNYNSGCIGNNINNPASGWCYVNPPAGYERDNTVFSGGSLSENQRLFYWFPIGSVGTVWRKPNLPTLTLIKNVINDSGGTLTPANFPLAINGVPATNGTANELLPGTYAASETPNSAYAASAWGGDCSPDGIVTLNYRDNKTCTITNNDILAPSPQPIRCESIVVYPTSFITNESGATTFQITNIAPATYTGNFLWNLVGDGRLTVSENTRSAVLLNRSPGSYITIRSEDGACAFNIPGQEPYVPPPPSPPPSSPPPSSGEVPCTSLNINQDEILLGLPNQTFSATVAPSNFTGEIRWKHIKSGEVVEETIGRYATLHNLNENSTVSARATPTSNTAACIEQIFPETLISPPRQAEPTGSLTKRSFEIVSHGNVIKKDSVHDTAEFQISFLPTAPVPRVTIHDTMRRTLYGTARGEITRMPNIYNGKDFKVEKRKNSISSVSECNDDAESNSELCYEGDIFERTGLTLRNIADETILITYRGKLTKSNINPEYCKTLDPSFCGEKFTNTVSDSLGNSYTDTLYTPCPFILTRGIGDTVFERDLSVGSDISSCAAVPNIEGPVTTPEEPPEEDLPRTGASEILNIAPHTLCQQSNLDDLSQPEAFRNPLRSVSSAICEFSMTFADVITPPQIRSDTLENITRITRFNNNLGVGNKVTVANLNSPPTLAANPNPNFEVYKLRDANLIIDSMAQPVGEGARTYVIENGDLIINGNIAYSETAFDLANIKKIPSIAFIVINGSIKISPHVTRLDGIYVTFEGQGKEARPSSGKIFGWAPSENPLRINGSVYGDIEPLFESRAFMGSAERGEGTIVINYDGRLFYNMPPGLSEILEISQEQVAR